MTHTLKQNNNHKRHETHCQNPGCGRALPKSAYKTRCATCIKHELGTSTPSIHFKREKVAA